jgi:hypothetical protein
MAMKYLVKPTKYSVYAETSNPVFGEDTLTVEIEDAGGGPFIVITSLSDTPQAMGKIEVELNQWIAVDKAARQLIKDFDYE